MVELRIVSKSKKKLMDIGKILLESNLVQDVNIIDVVKRLNLINGKITTSSIYMLTSKTKALLFPDIDAKLKSVYKSNMPELYSLPIVHMDYDQIKNLTKNIVEV